MHLLPRMIEPKQRPALFSMLALLVLLILLFFQLVDLEMGHSSDRGKTNLPVSIRATSQADYSRDSERLVVPPMSEGIFQQIIMDLQGTGSADDRISTLQVSLSMPVPTMTLNPRMPTSTLPPPTNVIPGTVTPQTTGTMTSQPPTPTNTLVPATPTPTSMATLPAPTVTRRVKSTPKPKPTKRP